MDHIDQNNVTMLLKKIEIIFETILEMQNRIDHLESIIHKTQPLNSTACLSLPKNNLRFI